MALLAFVLGWLATVLSVWQAPPANLAGSLWLMGCGLVLGLYAVLLRPTRRLRAAALGALVLAAVVLNLAWWPALYAENAGERVERQPDDSFAERHARHTHVIVRRKYAHFLLGEHLVGKPVRFVEGVELSPWRLLVLGGASEIQPIPGPLPPLPELQLLTEGPEGRMMAIKGLDDKGESLVRVYQAAAILESAESADYFMALPLYGVDFLVPGPFWEELRGGRRSRPARRR